MSELAAFAQLGFRHITDPNGADHILFLLALAAIYRFRDWRECAWVVTAFTIGHSLTLAMAVTNVLALPPGLIEFLIPVTIAATAVENLIAAARATPGRARRHRPLFAGVFGLVHGAGFANYLRSLFVDDVAIPLLGFNVGIEVGQILVLALAFSAFALVDRGLERVMRPRAQHVAPRPRAFLVSIAVVGVAARWTVERAPW